MSDGGHPESGLSKSVWSEADFEEMGWHDATVHGLHVQRTDGVLPRLLLDLDYIVRWVHPVPPAKYFSFWMSPATLVFDEFWDLEGDFDYKGTYPELTIDDVHRLVPDDGRADIPQWHIEGHAFDLKFRAAGFRQYFRQAPRLASVRVLSPDERGGCCFTEAGFG
ncbi:hypothetical protein [Streptomyces purpurogeneiscleroticus]|uniref:hypothetical protein n=1 Tax=Streptomyces purpurogeneiscleroticus TaxID=68259 RepID=UPI001CBC15DB|nr:hypothetical protein [Streptomyces purpurogeneiscleroticus]MBZ4019774.1 hypothetical protein [Streptomyces purpurogeneiscleroticus]